MKNVLLEIKDLTKVYTQKSSKIKHPALQGINLQIEQGDYVAIMGESGSGKTTLMNILASFDYPSSGKVFMKGEELFSLAPKDLARFRREELGFVFQDFSLIDYFTIYENIAFPLVINHENKNLIKARVEELASDLHIDQLLNKYPYELSGGEKQRTACARALIMKPSLLLADEPTGSLDSKNSKQLLQIFKASNQKGQTILMVTHSLFAASTASRVLILSDGKIIKDIQRGNESDQEFAKRLAKDIMPVEQKAGWDGIK